MSEPPPDRSELLGLPLRVRDTAVLLLLTVLADICLYRAWGGTGFATLLVVALFVLTALQGLAAGFRARRVILTVVALAAVLVWSAWWLVFAMTFVAVFLLAVQLWRPEWSLLESLWGAASSLLHALPRLLGHAVACRDVSRRPGRQPFPVKIVVIPIAVTVLFVLVFAAANPVISGEFSKWWERVLDVMLRLSDYINVWRFLFWCGWMLVFAALIRPVVRSDFVDLLAKLDTRLEPCDVDRRVEVNFLAALVTLVSVNVLFLAYNCMDAVYLYFKATLPAGITWTAYTHAGCGWLTFGLFLSTVVLGVIFWNELNFHARSPMLKTLGCIWIAQNAVLAVGTLRRIHMYIDYSGLTHLLLTGVYGSILVMAGLGIMAMKVYGNRNAIWLLRRYVAAFAFGLMALVLTPHGLVCARYNVPRILAGKPHAMWPVVLKDLPADALPPVIRLLDYSRSDGDTAKEKLVREGVAGILGLNMARLEKEQSSTWRQWQASSWWALKHLRAASGKIHAMVPPERWAMARDRLKADYDLSGEP